MPFKSVVRELREMREGIGSMSWRRSIEGRLWAAGNEIRPPGIEEDQQQGQWANLPPELLLDVIQRLEATELSWPDRRNVVVCAAVCRAWREATCEVVPTPEQCSRVTFPISLKQPGPRDTPIQCYIRRNRAMSTYRLYLGLAPALQEENDKFLLAARKIRRATSTDFVISLSPYDFSRGSNMYIGKMRSNFLGMKFTIYDSQPPDTAIMPNSSRSTRWIHSKQVSPRVPAGNYNIATIAYELNVLRTRGPRRMQCTLHSIPVSAIQGGTAPTPTSFTHSLDERFVASPSSSFSSSLAKGKELLIEFSSTSLAEPSAPFQTTAPLILKNKSPRWHEQLQCWCLNFRGRVTVASVKNFQLVAAVDSSLQLPVAEQERVMLQFGKIGKDIFTMDYRYPLSAFQAFAVCLTSFGTKPVCE